jgi:nucleoside-diphosphate-sugar epimerase
VSDPRSTARSTTRPPTSSAPCVSFFSVWGPGQRPDLALENFRRKLAAGQPVIIKGDGSQRRDLTHVEDVARAVELALRWPGPGADVLNVGTGHNHSVMDMLAAVTPPGSKPRIDYRPANPADVPATLADIRTATTELGWTPRIAFPNGPLE